MGKHFFSSFLGAIIGALLVLLYLHFFKAPSPEVTPVPSLSKSSFPGTFSGENVVTKAVEKILPSVVNIDTKAFIQYDSPAMDPFGRFFGFPPYESKVIPKMGQGTGVIVGSNGLILTNEHVIHAASEIMVTLSGNTHLPGKVKGADQISDIALIQVATKDLVTATLGDSDRTVIGETVIAVGNPYKFQHTVTVGVLSGRERSISEQSKDFQDLLQTDAAINPGNSGGPLVNIRGEVIGINTAIVPFAQGIGFAIPINTAKNVMNQLLTKGKVSRPYLGIYMQDINEQLARQIDLPMNEGVIIVATIPGSPAMKARLLPRDVVEEINGKKIHNSDELRRIVKGTRVGERINMKIWRAGKVIEVQMNVGEGPSS